MRLVSEHRPAYLATLARRYRLGEKPGKARLPVLIHDDVLLAAGAVMPVSIEAAPLVVETCQRIAPWCPVILAPRVLMAPGQDVPEIERHEVYEVHGGREWEVYSGIHLQKTSTLIVSLTHPSKMLRTACHEAWHAIERRLSREWKDLIDADLSPLEWGMDHSYWTDPEERRARAFDVWCGRLIEGLPGAFTRTNIDQIFALAWSGELGDELAREQGNSDKLPAKRRRFPLFHRKFAQ